MCTQPRLGKDPLATRQLSYLSSKTSMNRPIASPDPTACSVRRLRKPLQVTEQPAARLGDDRNDGGNERAHGAYRDRGRDDVGPADGIGHEQPDGCGGHRGGDDRNRRNQADAPPSKAAHESRSTKSEPSTAVP